MYESRIQEHDVGSTKEGELTYGDMFSWVVWFCSTCLMASERSERADGCGH